MRACYSYSCYIESHVRPEYGPPILHIDCGSASFLVSTQFTRPGRELHWNVQLFHNKEQYFVYRRGEGDQQDKQRTSSSRPMGS